MKYIAHLFFAALACLLLPACESVIDVDLNSASPRYVIEGVITDQPGPHQVRITQTKNFDENNDFEGIDYAEVSIADDKGNAETLTYTGNGIYQTREARAIPGRTYTLTVNIAGESFSAVCPMHAPVGFEMLYLELISGFNNQALVPYASYTDLPDRRNYYRHILYVNGEKVSSIFISRDERNDGSVVERALPYFRSGNLLGDGDTVRVDMLTIDRSVYDYFFSLDQTIDQDAASPANPVSNFTGGALGYFSVHPLQTRTVVVE